MNNLKFITATFVFIALSLTGECSAAISGACDTCVTAECCEKCFCASTLIPRSADSNTALLWGLPFMHLEKIPQTYTGQMFALEYQQSFNAQNLGNCLFGTNRLLFQGSQVPNRSITALIADNFGLSQTFNGALSIKPVIQNTNLHYVGFVGFDTWTPGLWAKLDVTFSHQRRSLVCGTSLVTSDTSNFAPFPVSYMEIGETVEPAQSIQQALSGNFLFGDMQTPWLYGKWSFCSRKATAVAGLSLNLGYDFYNKHNSYLGAFFRFTAPTGTQDSHYVFDAVVGNGHYWEVGGGVCARWELWNNHNQRQLALLLDGYVTTLLPSHHTRTFDFNYTTTGLYLAPTTVLIANGANISVGEPHCLSRYVLLKQLELQTPTDDDPSSYAYAGNMINAINFTTRSARSHVSVKGDATLKMLYSSGGLDVGFGYNIYGQSREKISRISPSCLTGTNWYGIKGYNGVGYNVYATDGTNIVSGVTYNEINGTYRYANAYQGAGIQPNVVINGTSFSQDGVALAITRDSDTFIATWNSNNNNSEIVVGTPVADLTADLIVPRTSVNPYIVSDRDLDICSGTAPRQLTNKGFLSFDYTWIYHKASPFIGFAAEVEGGSRSCDVNQWGLWLRGGFSY